MSSLLAWLPALFSTFISFFRSPEKAFLSVFIPVLLLIPQIFYAQTEGFPKLNFSETCIIPIFIAALFFRTKYWKFSLMDLAIGAFIACAFYSEMRTADTHYAINKLATMLCNILAPYVLAKMLIHPLDLSEKLAKRFVFLMFINVLIAFWEMRFVTVPQIALLQPLFPQTENGWVPLFRYGLTRIRGPFVQTILFGIGLSVAILLNYWLLKNRRWKANFKSLPALPIRKGTILMLFLCFGLFMTFSRGPWISCFLGFILASAGFSSSPVRNLFVRTLLICLAILFFYQVFIPYTEVNPGLSRSETEENIAYRGEIYRRYTELAYQSPTWGWGTLEQPLLSGLKSIDNEYLLLFLQKGLVGLTLFIGMVGWSFLRLLKRGLQTSTKDLAELSFTFTLIGVLFTLAFSFVTVFMGMQTEMIFFMVLGWAEGFVLTKGRVA